MAEYAKAEPLLPQALGITKRDLGENHPDYVTSLKALALLYHDMDDYVFSSRSGFLRDEGIARSSLRSGRRDPVL